MADGATLPSNLPALVLNGDGRSIVPTFNAADFELRRADGGSVDIEVRASTMAPALVVRPLEPLTPGASFLLRWPMLCPGANTATRHESRFQTSAEKPLPTTLASHFAVTERSRRIVDGRNRCSYDVDAAFARFAVTPSAELVPFLATTRWELLVDGALWTAAPFGALDTNGALLAANAYPAVGREVLTIHGACDAGVPGDRGLALGSHVAELRGFIAGVDRPLSVTGAFTLTCEQQHPCGCADGGPSGEPPDAGVGEKELPRNGCSAVTGFSSLALALLAARFKRRTA